jgi:hypothetical protein
MDDDNQTSEKPKISQEFVNIVKKYLEIDDVIHSHKETIKSLNDTKKEYEDKIISYLTSINEHIITINDNKLKLNITKSKGSIKKNNIEDTLKNYFNDNIKIKQITETIINNLPTKEKKSLKRTQ